LEPLLNFLRNRKGVNLIGNPTTVNRAPTVSFTADGIDPESISKELASQKIGIANGNCYAYRLMEALGIPPEQGVARLSFVHYTSRAEIDRLIDNLDLII
jgi:selenocysteine lyase/cysteine desulfurase